MSQNARGSDEASQPGVKSWQEMRAWQVDLLQRATGESLEEWNARVNRQDFADEAGLRAWLAELGVTGYAQMLLVHERFGYPEFFTKSAEELIDGQYADRLRLRPILDAILARLPAVGQVTIQARKTYVSLLTPRRTFAVVAATTKNRVDLGLRLPDHEPNARLLPAKSLANDTITVRIALTAPDDVDDDVLHWLRQAYKASS